MASTKGHIGRLTPAMQEERSLQFLRHQDELTRLKERHIREKAELVSRQTEEYWANKKEAPVSKELEAARAMTKKVREERDALLQEIKLLKTERKQRFKIIAERSRNARKNGRKNIEREMRKRGIPKVSWWSTQVAEMGDIYEEAYERRWAGEDVEVDHIIPLNGENVSGLHIAANLRIVSKEVNQAKSNEFHEFLIPPT